MSMMRLKAKASGRWCTSPGTSIDVIEGQIYTVPTEFAAYMMKHNAATVITGEDVPVENKAFKGYEKQSSQSVPKFETKEEALQWASDHGLTVDKRKSLEKIKAEIEKSL